MKSAERHAARHSWLRGANRMAGASPTSVACVLSLNRRLALSNLTDSPGCPACGLISDSGSCSGQVFSDSFSTEAGQLQKLDVITRETC